MHLVAVGQVRPTVRHSKRTTLTCPDAQSRSCSCLLSLSESAFFWAYSGIGIVGISQTIVRSRATLIPEWL